MPEGREAGHAESQLLEVLRRIGREAPGQVGFGVPRQARSRRGALALLAALPSADGSLLTAAQEAGADGALVALVDGPTVEARTAKDGAAWPICGIAPDGRPATPAELDDWK